MASREVVIKAVSELFPSVPNPVRVVQGLSTGWPEAYAAL